MTVTAVDITDANNKHSVFSAYSDLHYDPSLLRAVDITYSDSFDMFRSGTIDNASGLIHNLGATMGSFLPISDTSIAKVRFEVLSPGNTEISLQPSASPFLETTVFGLDGDQRDFSRYDAEDLRLIAPYPDIAVSKFYASGARALNGTIEINYEISNHGFANSGAFWINLYLSDDEKLETSDDTLVWRKYMAPDAITGLATTGLLTDQITLPKDILYSHATMEDPRYPDFGTASTSIDSLYLQVTPESPHGDSLASNNTRSDAITYFPWDIDGNGRVTMSDAVAMLNRIGRPSTEFKDSQSYDLNGDSFITQSEAMAVFERIGLTVNTNI